jgi:hypothetical protein
MDHNTTAQTLGKRKEIEKLDREFARLHSESCAILDSTPADILYTIPAQAVSSLSGSALRTSVAENILRCGAAIEQTFGGITANLWDDPFEWTLPEYLTTPEKIKDHLAEVETVRQRAFSSFANDACLMKHVTVPSGQTRTLTDLLLETLRRAKDHQGQALVARKSLSGISPAGFII